jgi:hypothetical protein
MPAFWLSTPQAAHPVLVCKVKPEVCEQVGWLRETGENLMRVFIVLVCGLIAVAAAAILDNFVQEASSAAFAEPSARL